MEAGTVTRGCYPFYDVVFALEVTGETGRVIRYGEISGAAAGIRQGSKVSEGQVIGYEGMTGRTTGPHLHWMVELGQSFRNPRLFL